MSASRVGSAEGMDVDEAGVAPPTNEWMEAAQRAADTDGILENGPAKRQKVCNSCNTLTALHLQTLHKNAHKKRESLKKVRVRVARSCAKKKNEKGHPKGLLRLTSELPPKSLPNHCRVTAVALPWHCRARCARARCAEAARHVPTVGRIRGSTVLLRMVYGRK